MALLSPFQLPDEHLISSLCVDYPCREPQLRSLVALLSPYSKTPKNIVVHGLEATGKSTITVSTLSRLCSSYSYPDLEINGVDERKGSLYYTVVKSAECITGRHLLETIVGAIAHAVGWKKKFNKCENLAQLAVEIDRLLDDNSHNRDSGEGESDHTRDKFVLVLDGIDRQRDAPPTLLPALARMGEVIPGLTIIFIITSPRPHFLHVPGVPHIYFQAYTKQEALQIISLYSPPAQLRRFAEAGEGLKLQKEMKDIWTRFCSAVWDTLSKHSGRDIISFRSTCTRLWPSFIAPLNDGLFTTRDFGRLLVSRRSLFQDERVLIPSVTTTAINTITPSSSYSTSQPLIQQQAASSSTSAGTKVSDPKINTGRPNTITTQLPLQSRLLLIAAYLASYTPARNDALLYMKASLQKNSRRKKGGATRARPSSRASKHRKISAKLLGPQAFVLERMLAIFHAVRLDSGVGGGGGGVERRHTRTTAAATADIPLAIATLASLRLVVRMSAAGVGGGGMGSSGGGGAGGDVLDAGAKWKVNVGWEVVRAVARSVGVEVEDFVVE